MPPDIKADVIHTPGAHSWHAFIIAKTGVLRIRPTSGRDTHNVMLDHIDPMHWKAEIWRLPFR